MYDTTESEFSSEDEQGDDKEDEQKDEQDEEQRCLIDILVQRGLFSHHPAAAVERRGGLYFIYSFKLKYRRLPHNVQYSSAYGQPKIMKALQTGFLGIVNAILNLDFKENIY